MSDLAEAEGSNTLIPIALFGEHVGPRRVCGPPGAASGSLWGGGS